jgi:hypothetical protein
VDTEWQETFRHRMHRFQTRRAPTSGETAVSIKVRITSGCFHREHSPRAYELIDRALDKLTPSGSPFAFEEHESGPEILVYLALTTAGISLAKSVTDLIVAIIKARSEGIKKGDTPSHPLELIVRRVQSGNEFREETVLRIGHTDSLDEAKLEQRLKEAAQKLLRDEQAPATKSGSQKKRTRKR